MCEAGRTVDAEPLGLGRLREIGKLTSSMRTTAGGVLSFEEAAIIISLRSHTAANPSWISGTFGLTPSKVTRCMAKLEDLGLVEGVPDSSDLRKCVFKLTNRGEHAALEYVREYDAGRIDDMISLYAVMQQASRRARAAAQEAPLGETGHWILLSLGIVASPLTVSQLQDISKLSQPRVSMAVAALKKRGLVKTVSDSVDRRRRPCALTNRGRPIAEALADAFRSFA